MINFIRFVSASVVGIGTNKLGYVNISSSTNVTVGLGVTPRTLASDTLGGGRGVNDRQTLGAVETRRAVA